MRRETGKAGAYHGSWSLWKGMTIPSGGGEPRQCAGEDGERSCRSVGEDVGEHCLMYLGEPNREGVKARGCFHIDSYVKLQF